jgi:hypothetical protein
VLLVSTRTGHGATLTVIGRRRWLVCDCGRRFPTIRVPGETNACPAWERHVKAERKAAELRAAGGFHGKH